MILVSDGLFGCRTGTCNPLRLKPKIFRLR